MKKIVTSGAFLHYSMVLTLIGTLTFLAPAISQDAEKSLLNQADQHYRKGEWPMALLTFEAYLESNPSDVSARINMGMTLMKLNRPEAALQQWEYILTGKQEIPTEVYFQAGRACHQLDRYTDAEKYYRSYIEHAGQDAVFDLVSYYLKQIGAAYSAGSASTHYLIENAGSSVNTGMDEFHPVYSPNIDQRFYYSTHDGEASSSIRSAPQVRSSMKYAEVRNGSWKTGGPLDADLIGKKGTDEQTQELHLVDFSKDGQQVIFTRPSDVDGKMTFIKSFEDVPGQRPVTEWIHPVYNSTLGDRDLFTINDSAYLFSSSRLEGYGGYDIFVTFKRLGQWAVQNLGPQINSRYDEIAPFLSRDGREIYFSSNSDKSIGGYDIFFATFDDDMETWTLPHNMLPPLNSGMDDVEIRLSQNGDEALFTSNRTGGAGGYDIYHVYFDENRPSQNLLSQPPYFYQVNAFRSFASDDGSTGDFSEKPLYKLPVIYFGERPVVISPDIKEKLDEVVKYGKLYPHTGLIAHVFSGIPPQNDFSLYRSVMLLKNLTGYLTGQGLDPGRIQLRLYGYQYPRYTALPEGDQEEMRKVKSPNQRVEFGFTGTKNLPVRFEVVGFESETEQSAESPYEEWKKRTDDLYFRVQVAESEILLKGANIIKTDDFMLIIEEDKGHYGYFSGIFQGVDAALTALTKYRSQGYDQARIVAFIGETRIPGEEITSEVIEAYPELKKYIIYQN